MSEILVPRSREDWLAFKRGTIGASEAAALLGAHPYLTAYELWAVKAGRVATDPTETPPMRRGRLLEPIAVDVIAEERPAWRLTPNPIPGGKVFHDQAARLSCTPDLFAIDPERTGTGVVQIKSVEPSVFRRTWTTEDRQIEPPLYAVVQAIVEAHLTGATWAAVAALVVGHGIGVEIIDVPLHGGVIDRVRAETAAFWRMVESGHTPDPDYGRDAEVIKAIFAEDDGTEIDLSEDNEAPALAAEDLELGRRLSEDDKRRTEVRAALIHKMGPAAAARLADGTLITAKTVHRKPYSIAASSFRQVRVKAPRGAGQPFTGEF